MIESIMGRINLKNTPPPSLTETISQQTQANTTGPTPGQELGKDTLSLSKAFAKADSTGSANALSHTKETAKSRPHRKEKPAHHTARVSAAKSMADSQVISVKPMKTCPACKGMGCATCKPALAEAFSQEESNRNHKKDEVSKIESVRRKKEAIKGADETERVARLKKVSTDTYINPLYPPKKGAIHILSES